MSLRIYLDEDVDTSLAVLLSNEGHDVLTTAAAGRAGRGISDDDQLAFATAAGRAILTHDIDDYILLAKEWALDGKDHSGIILTHRHRVFEMRRRFRLFAARYPDGTTNICDFL